MHELVNNKNEKKKENRDENNNIKARSIRQKPRTGLTTSSISKSSSSTSLSIEEKQQKRIAARAATAMAQVLQRSRRREPRSLLMWGDRKKAIIKSYPDGGQEIIVPQTLTIEQEHYEFPPRSRFLKKLATSTAERKRLSIVIDEPIIETAPMLKKPDQLSLAEWFSKKEQTTKVSKTNRAVIDWMNDVERSSKSLLLKVKPSPTCSTTKIQFKSDAGKRWANSITSNTSLLPPDDHSRKHYVPRRLLHVKKLDTNNSKIDEATSKIQSMWKEYQSTKNSFIENQIGLTAMETTGQRTPIAGMSQILVMLQNTAKLREQSLQDRMEQVKLSLKQETLRRQSIQDSLNLSKENEKSLLSRVAELEVVLNHSKSSSKKSSVVVSQPTSRKPSVASIRNSSVVPTSRKPSVVSSARKLPAAPPSSRKPSVIPPSSRKPSVVPSSRKPPIPPPSTRKPSSKPPIPSQGSTRRSARTSSLANAGISSPRIIKK